LDKVRRIANRSGDDPNQREYKRNAPGRYALCAVIGSGVMREEGGNARDHERHDTEKG
jgi:hypothetical protein